MAKNDTGNVAYQRGQDLKITKRTVFFGNNVYQFKNITGFSEGTIYKTAIIPWLFVLIGVIAGFMALSANATGAGFVILIACAVCVVINKMQKDEYGLILTLNSGDKNMFVTRDYAKLSEVIQQLYTFMESDKDGTYLYTINNNSIKIHGNMTGGVAATGNKSSTINSNT